MAALNIRNDACELDLLSLGAVVHRLDPGILPFRKARLARGPRLRRRVQRRGQSVDCFGLKTGVATAMVDSPLGELVKPASARRA